MKNLMVKLFIIELIGDFEDYQRNQDFIRLGYLACYIKLCYKG